MVTGPVIVISSAIRLISPLPPADTPLAAAVNTPELAVRETEPPPAFEPLTTTASASKIPTLADVVFVKTRVSTIVSNELVEPIPLFAVNVRFVAMMFVREAASPRIAPLAAVSVASPPARLIDPAVPKTMSPPVAKDTSVDTARVIARLRVIVPLFTFPICKVLAVI